MAQTQIYGVRETLAEIKQIDQKLYFQCIKQIKDAAAPMENAIGAAFGIAPPMSGMANRGRLAYKKPKITSKFGGKKHKGLQEWGLLKIIVSGAAAQMNDLASKSHNGGKSKEYKINGQTRSHRINGQGDQMIKVLDDYGKASRYVWPTAKEMLPMIILQVTQAVEDVSKIVNKNLVLRK